jgi:hypothetical protein
VKRVHGIYRFESEFVEDRRDGWAGFDLYRMEGKARDRVARVVFWDALGQFHIETFKGDIPVDIAEELIKEAKAAIKTS